MVNFFQDKEDESFNHMRTLSISRVAPNIHLVEKLSLTPELIKRGVSQMPCILGPPIEKNKCGVLQFGMHFL